VANHLRLLELPEKAQEAVSRGLITMGHARALIGAGAPERILGLVERIVRDGLSVRQTEAVAKGAPATERSPKDSGADAGPERPPWLVELENRVRASLGAKVRIQNRPGYRGQIILEYFGQEDLERLTERLAPRPKV
jgi:ParB family chromosome partitioning protein